MKLIKTRTVVLALATACLLGAGSFAALVSTSRTVFRAKVPDLQPVNSRGPAARLETSERFDRRRPGQC